MVDHTMRSRLILHKRFEHDPAYRTMMTRRIQDEIADHLMPLLWGTGKHVVDITLETVPARIAARHTEYYMLEPEDTIVEAQCTITKVNVQHVTMYQAAPINYEAYSYSKLAGAATEEMKRRLARQWRLKGRPWLQQQARGLFPWQFEEQPAKTILRKTVRQKLNELARGLFPWHYE